MIPKPWLDSGVMSRPTAWNVVSSNPSGSSSTARVEGGWGVLVGVRVGVGVIVRAAVGADVGVAVHSKGNPIVDSGPGDGP